MLLTSPLTVAPTAPLTQHCSQVVVTVTAASCFMATVMSVAVPLTVAATVVVPDLVRAAFAWHGLPDLLHRQWTTPVELQAHGD